MNNSAIEQILESLEKKAEKRKRKEANRLGRNKEAMARRKLANAWMKIAKRGEYKRAAVKECCRNTTFQMEDELFDGIILSLNDRNSKKSYPIQKRILRRIVEKRQAQQVYDNVGRTETCLFRYIARQSTSWSMRKLQKYQMCI